MTLQPILQTYAIILVFLVMYKKFLFFFPNTSVFSKIKKKLPFDSKNFYFFQNFLIFSEIFKNFCFFWKVLILFHSILILIPIPLYSILFYLYSNSIQISFHFYSKFPISSHTNPILNEIGMELKLSWNGNGTELD